LARDEALRHSSNAHAAPDPIGHELLVHCGLEAPSARWPRWTRISSEAATKRQQQLRASFVRRRGFIRCWHSRNAEGPEIGAPTRIDDAGEARKRWGAPWRLRIRFGMGHASIAGVSVIAHKSGLAPLAGRREPSRVGTRGQRHRCASAGDRERGPSGISGNATAASVTTGPSGNNSKSCPIRPRKRDLVQMARHSSPRDRDFHCSTSIFRRWGQRMRK
jgi:hypothetical protein